MLPLATPTSHPGRDWAGTLFALAFPTVVTYVYFILLADQPARWQQLAYGVGKSLQFGFPLVWVIGVQRQRLSLPRVRPDQLRDGGLLGLAILGGMAVLYLVWFRHGGLPPAAVAAIRAKVAGIGVGSSARFVALGAFYAVIHSLLEEYYWRWFVYRQLRSLAANQTAVVVSALGFTAHHVCVLGKYFGWQDLSSLVLMLFFSLSVTIGGMLWAWMYERQGTLYGVWLSHLLVDAGIFAVGYDLVLR